MFDAMYTGYSRGAAYSLLYPRFSAVVPRPDMGTVPVAITVPIQEGSLLQFVNSWIEEPRASGLIDAKLRYWIQGEGARSERGPRWSVARDVLGWWKE